MLLASGVLGGCIIPAMNMQLNNLPTFLNDCCLTVRGHTVQAAVHRPILDSSPLITAISTVLDAWWEQSIILGRGEADSLASEGSFLLKKWPLVCVHGSNWRPKQATPVPTCKAAVGMRFP